MPKPMQYNGTKNFKYITYPLIMRNYILLQKEAGIIKVIIKGMTHRFWIFGMF